VIDGVKSGRFDIGLTIDFLAGSEPDLEFRYGQPVMIFPAQIGRLAGGTAGSGLRFHQLRAVGCRSAAAAGSWGRARSGAAASDARHAAAAVPDPDAPRDPPDHGRPMTPVWRSSGIGR
jgi:hypothetical protein